MPRSRPAAFPFAIVALLLCLGLMPNVGVAQDDKIELRIWDQFTGPETEIVDQIYEAFTAANPNITIRREAIQTDQMRDTVNTALSSGTGPDIIFYDAGPGYAGVLVNAGLLTPLEEFAAQYGWRDKIAAPSLEATSLGGTLYGLPLQVDLIGMYHNKTLMDQEGLTVPETVEQLKTFCGQAKEKGYIPLAFSDNPGWQGFHQFSMTANAMIGPEAMRALLYQNQGTWNTPEIVTAIKTFFVDLKDAGCFSEDANALTYEDGNSLFYTGQSLMHPTGSWLVRNLQENMPDADLGYIPFPQIDGAKGRYWISGVGSAFYISANSEHQTEAAQLLDYFFSPEVTKRWVEECGFYVPVQLDTAGLNVSPLYRSILDTLQGAIGGGAEFGYNVDVLAPPEFNDAMSNGFQAILSGDKTPEELAAELQAAWETGMSAAPAGGTPTT